MVITLVCMLAGDGSVVRVEIEASQTVGDLKEMTNDKLSHAIQCNAHQLNLYRAKRGSSWMRANGGGFEAMRIGEIPVPLKELMQERRQMISIYRLDDVLCFGKNFQPGDGNIHVLVELPRATKQVLSSQSTTVRTERRKRWHELNEIYEKSKNARTNSSGEDDDDESGEAIEVTASELGEVYRVLDRYTELYIPPRKPVPDDVIDDLAKNWTTVFKATSGWFATSPGVQRHLIGPVLMTLCNLFDDMTLDFDRTVAGNQLHAQGQLDFVLMQGKKTAMCVVHAKRGNFTQAITQALVGCEAIAERENQHVVFGVATDFITWYLFRSGEKSIKSHVRTLGISSPDLDMASLRAVCEMMYGALADHDEEDKKDH